MKYLKKKDILRKSISSLILTTILASNFFNPSIVKAETSYEDFGKLSIEENFKSDQKYSFADLNKMNNKDLIKLLKTIKWHQITDLFKYNSDAAEFYKDEQRLNAIISALHESGNTYTKTDSKGIRTLVEVLRSGFYIGYYNPEMSFLNDRKLHDKCIPAIIAIEKNPNFKLGTSEQNDVVSGVGKLIGNASCDLEVVNRATSILKQYNQNFDSYKSDREKSAAVYDLVDGIRYDMTQKAIYEENQQFEKTEWYMQIDDYLDELKKWALIGEIDEESGWIINNGIYNIGNLSKLHSDSNSINMTLTRAMEIYPESSEQYFEAVSQISQNFAGIDYNGNSVNQDALKEKLKNKYLPNQYSFDDGKIIFKTGDKVTEDKIQRLYWALNEVKSQFFRTVGKDKAIESGNPDEVLTVVIYNSPTEYKMNSKLYGYSTDNGGIYIEPVGTFFTYERTPEESIYTLEELFRHEFTHYLQGRYVEPGMWGRTKLYEGDKLAWFDEGSAEFFAGATRTDGILPRKSVISNIVNSNPSERYTVNDTLHATYGNWDFYHYSSVFNDYMHNSDWEVFDNLVNYVSNEDVSGYEKYIKLLSSDQNVNNRYQDHMQSLIDNYDRLSTPLVDDSYMKEYEGKNKNQILKEVSSNLDVKNLEIAEGKSQFFNTITLKGHYVGRISNGKYEDWKNMDKAANEFLNDLSTLKWDGYKTFTCYFTNYNVNEKGEYEFDIVFHGKQGLGEVDEDIENPDIENPQNPDLKVEREENNTFETANPILKNEVIRGSMENEDVIDVFSFEAKTPRSIEIQAKTLNKEPINWVLYKEKDLDKYITGIKIMDSESKTVELDEAGKYYIYVYKATTDKADYEIKVNDNTKDEVDEPKEDLLLEAENNDSFEAANILSNNQVVEGSFADEDVKDIFYFDVEEDQKVNIKVNNKENLGLNWLLFTSDDFEKYMGYANQNGDILENSYDLKPGRYYICVYRFDNSNGKYTIQISK